MQRVAAAVVIALCTLLVHAGAGRDLDRLLKAKTLKCSFAEGATHVWKDGSLKTEKGSFDADITFDSIDRRTGKARMIGNTGANDVAVGQSLDNVTFIENFEAGVAIYTVFPELTTEGEFVAAASRHLSILWIPAFSQFRGTCKVWQGVWPTTPKPNKP